MHDFIWEKNETMLTSYHQQSRRRRRTNTCGNHQYSYYFTYYFNTYVQVREFFSIEIIRWDLLYQIGYGEYLQTIVFQPKSVEVPIGETVILDCRVFNQYGEVAW